MRQQSERLWVVEDLYGMPDDNRHHELVNGLLVSEPLAGGRHGRIAATLAERIGCHAREQRLGVVLTCDAGFVLHRSPDTVRGPDVAFVNRSRYEALEDETQAIPGPPDLAIEVLSPHDRPSAVHAKVADYLAAGTLLVWIVDPDRRSVAAYRSLLEPQIVQTEDLLTAEDVLPGFRLRVAELFEI
jgi:Uma2 family endonuclease